jgi:hypothetical protein
MHGLLETTMAVQNHDAALGEKEQLEMMLQKSKTIMNNLQDRVRQLETAVVFQLAAESRGPRAEPRRVWSVEELQHIRQSFEKSHRGILDLNSHGSIPVAHSIDQKPQPAQAHDNASQSHESHAASIFSSSDIQSTFGADYFCTWLTTDAHAKDFHVAFRSQAVECGAALLTHKVIAVLPGSSALLHYCISFVLTPSHRPLQIIEEVKHFQLMSRLASSCHIQSEYLGSKFEDDANIYRFVDQEPSSNPVQVV